MERVINLKIVEPQSGRLKWWRKKAIEDALPPILLLYISGLDNYIILDGHSRLQAAYDQKVVPDVLILSPATKDSFTWSNEIEKQAILREVDSNKHLTQEKINELHIKAHTHSQLFYNTRIKATQNKSKEDCIKEVAKYLYSLDSLEKIEEFFYGEWKE